MVEEEASTAVAAQRSLSRQLAEATLEREAAEALPVAALREVVLRMHDAFPKICLARVSASFDRGDGVRARHHLPRAGGT